VFAGGWTLAAAEAIAGPGIEDTFEALLALADKSLIVVQEGDEEPRFRMLDTASTHALELLKRSGELADARLLHARHFADIAEAAAGLMQGAEQARTVARLEREEDNFRRALDWARTTGLQDALEEGLRIVGALAWYWFLHGYPPEAREWFEVLLGPESEGEEAEATGRITVLRANALNAAGFRATDQGEYELAARVHERALETWRRLHDVPGLVMALHGVGDTTVRQALAAAGFDPPIVVPEQAHPDPDFATVNFPNPEEPGAMDLAMALAQRHGADLVVANDPDADRCAVGVPTMRGWRLLRGDEVGALLADHLLRRGVRGVFATTIVSSSMLSRMAQSAGVEYAETLTGFKWIGRVPGLAFGYEEALGYCVAPALVRDKDGVSALLLVAELAAGLKASGQTLLDRLDEIAETHGLHATDQLSVRVSDLAVIGTTMARLRARPPTSLGGFAVEQVDDLSRGGAGLPPTDGLRFRLAGGGRVVVRPSGTEPKIKCYLEVVVPVDDAGVGAARISAAGRLDAIRGDFAEAAGL